VADGGASDGVPQVVFGIAGEAPDLQRAGPVLVERSLVACRGNAARRSELRLEADVRDCCDEHEIFSLSEVAG